MKDPTPKRYHYDAVVQSVHDGDTVVLDLDLGHGVWLRNQALRLHGLNAPEVTGKQKAAGLKSRDALAAMLLSQRVVVETFKDKDDKFGRLLARIYNLGTDGEWLCVNDEMVRLGHAKTWDGQGAKP